MKVSKYTVCVPSGNRHILYNCRTDHFVQVEKRLFEVYEQNEEHPEKLANIAPDFYEYLVGRGFILDDDIDETKLVLDTWKEEDEHGDLLRITINPTMHCNLRCYYCYEEHTKGTRMKQETIDATIAYIKKQVSSGRYKHISLSFFGGEPLLYFRQSVKPLLEEVKKIQTDDVKFSIHFTSNITLLTKEMTDYLLPWNPSFQITIDGNEFIHNMVKQLPDKDKSAYRIAINNIKKLLGLKLKVAIRFNYTAKTLERFYDVVEDMKDFTDEEKQYANINFHRIWQDTKIPDSELQETVDSLEEAFRKAGFFVVSSTSRTIGRCYGDVEDSLVINYDGNVYKCTARDFDDEHSEGRLQPDGSIVWNERHQKRIEVRYCNSTCHACLIFPLCHGGCSQNKLESLLAEGCLKQFTEKDKLDYIYQRIKGIYAEQKKKGG